jgi:predicted Rossmann fold flavoprotein
MKEINSIIIGAGASGLMLAARHKNPDIAIIESNDKIAKKIEISGGGKCNITNKNLTHDNYLGDKEFIKEILDNFSNIDLLEFLKQRGLDPIIKKDSQYFCKNGSYEIIDLLKKEINCPIYLNQKVTDIKKIKDDFIIKTNRDKYICKKLIIATGGLSYPSIGASDLAFKVAESFGHSINTPSPALVGFTVQKDQFWMKELSGISLMVSITIDTKKIVSDLLFTHKGISGPAILNTSLYWKKGKIVIDFLPKLTLNDKIFKSNKKISTALNLPKRFVKAFLNSIDLEDKALSDLSEDERDKLKLLKSYSFAPAGNFGYTKAEVTRGGISTDEIDSKTMMSKKCKNLYFLGECLDVTGELGGYNFQWAFSTAWRVGL